MPENNINTNDALTVPNVTPEDELLGTLPVLIYPAPLLKQISKPIENFDAELADFIAKLRMTMKVKDGVGLAAPQVGVLRRAAVVEYNGESWVLINPRVIESDGEQESEEGCLSFPGIYATVKRPNHVKVEAQDEHGETHVYEVQGFVARAFLHEMDHLDGKLFVDHLSPLKRGMIRRKMEKHPEGLPKRPRKRHRS